MDSVCNGPRSCPPKAHVHDEARHSSPSCYAGARSAEALDVLSLPGRDSHSRISKTSRFLEEVRVRLFADTPPSEKGGERSPLITNVAVSSQDPYQVSSMPEIDVTAKRASSSDVAPQALPSVPAMDMPSASDKSECPSARTAREVIGRDLNGSSSRLPSAACTNTSSKSDEKENIPSRHDHTPRIPRASMGMKLDFSSQRSSEPAVGTTPSMPISGPSPLFSPMQIDTQPPVPPLPSFLKQRAQASMGMGSAEHSQGSVGTDQGSDDSPKVPSAPGVLASSVTALQHLAGRAAQEAAASQGADQETANQVRYGLSHSPHHM